MLLAQYVLQCIVVFTSHAATRSCTLVLDIEWPKDSPSYLCIGLSGRLNTAQLCSGGSKGEGGLLGSDETNTFFEAILVGRGLNLVR